VRPLDTRIFPDAHEPAFVSEYTLRTCSGADPLGPAPISQLGGAVESEYLKTIEDAGFTETRIVGRLDYGASSSENTKRVTKTFGLKPL